MEVIENNFNREKQRAVCSKCGSVVAITAEDLTEGEFGCHTWTCPCCETVNVNDSSITLTEKNVTYPQHFASLKNGKQVSDKDLTEWVRQCVAEIDKGIEFSYRATGNSLVIAYKAESESCEVGVIVCNNGYEETFVQIPAERW